MSKPSRFALKLLGEIRKAGGSLSAPASEWCDRLGTEHRDRDKEIVLSNLIQLRNHGLICLSVTGGVYTAVASRPREQPSDVSIPATSMPRRVDNSPTEL